MDSKGDIIQPSELECSAPDSDGLMVRDLGRMAYLQALALQRQLQQEVIAAREDASSTTAGYLLLVEHDPPVITISRRQGARNHLVSPPETLAQAGIEVCETDRGGDITYHGPGQLVIYPLLDLNRLGLRLHGFMRFLEQVVIEGLIEFGIEGVRDAEATGVWVGGRCRVGIAHHDGQAPPLMKICAMGVRLSRWVSMHGLALNVNPDLSHFTHIIPCGLAGRGVTSMKELMGEECPAMEAIKQRMKQQFTRAVADLMAKNAARNP